MRRCLVTGATGGGVGTAAANFLAAKGWSVCIHGRDGAAVDRTVAGLPRSGEHCGLMLDLQDVGVIEDAVLALVRRWGEIDVLVSNAAPSCPYLPLDELTDWQWQQEMRQILDCQLPLCRPLIKPMVRNGFGRFIFMSSSAARRGTWGRSAAYASAKAGLLGLSKQIALEYARAGITSNVIIPSQLDTPRARGRGRRTQASLQEFASRSVPVGRVGSPADVCTALDYLLDSGFVTGQELILDGGLSLSTANRVIA